MSPYNDDINRSNSCLAHLPWRDRVAKSVDVLERRREHEKKEEGKIGSVMDKARREDMIHIKSKTVNFSWQRGNKIGTICSYSTFLNQVTMTLFKSLMLNSIR